MVAGSAWSAASDPSRSAAVHACPPDCLRPNRAATSVDDAANPAQRERRKLPLELCKPHRIGLPLCPVMLLQSGEKLGLPSPGRTTRRVTRVQSHTGAVLHGSGM